MRLIGSTIVSTDALSQLFGGKQAIGLDDIALAVDPFGLNGVKPGALCWQQEGQDTHACARLLDLQVVLANPGANSLTLVPGSIIPDQKPVGLATLEQTLAAPVQKWRGDRAHRSSRDKTEPHLLTPGFVRSPFLPQPSITGQRFGVRVAFFPGLFDQANGMLRVLPDMHSRQGKAAPPHLILKTNGPVRLLAGPSNQAVACVFFRRYCGSGLVIQCLARFQFVLSGVSARRTLSVESSVGMMPCSKLTWAANANVHIPRSLPKSWRLRCKRSCNCRHASSVNVVRRWWGRDEPSCSTANPVVVKPLITLRTVWSSQPSCLAIAGARSPRADASKIWQRRKTKASDERNPLWSCCRSSSVSGRIKMGVLMPSIVPHFLSPLVSMH